MTHSSTDQTPLYPTTANVLEAIARRVAGYTPTLLTAETWALVAGPLRALVLATDPTSAADAGQLLSNACLFLSWAQPLAGTVQLDLVLTDAWVNRYAVAHKNTRAELTLAREVPRLRRLIRAVAGEPARTRRGPRSEGTAPYSDDELTRLDAAGLGIEGLFALAADVAAGRESSNARGGRWLAARSVAGTAGLDLTLDKVAATSLARLMTAEQPVAVLVHDHGLSRRSLESIATHLERPLASEGYRLLRG